MWQLNFPAYAFKTKMQNGKTYIFDRIRKKYIRLTPEEWVRQHMITFLIEEKSYSPALMANEISIRYNSLSKRCDTVVYNSMGEPVMIIEYKSPEVEISQKTFDQIVVYNYRLKVKYLLVSNGLQHYCCKVDFENMSAAYLTEIPAYKTIL
jgi:hypothetical protein